MISDYALSILVKLHTKKHIIRGDIIDLSCTSDSVPTGLSAEFVLENETYASLRKYKQECYNGQQTCAIEMCSCSADDRSYSLHIHYMNLYTKQQNKLYVECSMNFGTKTIKDSIMIHIAGKFVILVAET